MQKPIIYGDIPDFDQTKQAVFQSEPIDKGDHVFVGVRVEDLPPEESKGMEEEMFES